MTVAAVVLSLLLALLIAAAGVGLLQGAEVATTNMDRLRVPQGIRTAIGVAEVLAALGLVAGLVVSGLGALAAAGVLALMVGAVAFHARAQDPPKEYLPAVVTALLAVLAGAAILSA